MHKLAEIGVEVVSRIEENDGDIIRRTILCNRRGQDRYSSCQYERFIRPEIMAEQQINS